VTAEQKVGAAEDLAVGAVAGAGRYAVGRGDELFAVTRKCRHLRADLADGTIEDDGCLVCPWHHAKYDVSTGRMVRGPQGVFAKIPGLGSMFKAITRVAPLGRGAVTERNGDLFVSAAGKRSR
jgi:nitrite reductase/ring-hydroxylating ferredoxin subunit